jgi:hypothetical protein
MTEPKDHELLADLARLPARDADARTAERVRRAAVDAFVEAKGAEGHTLHALALRASRAIMPIVVAGTVGGYLAWAVSAANALFR